MKGVSLPRTTYNQINVGASVQPNKLRPGDLVFFDTDRKRSGPDHVGIYIGGGKFIHAPAPGQGVKISSLADGYYMDRWMGGRRIPGVSASPTSGGGEALEVAPRLDAHELAETYGMSYSFFKSQPELWKMLNSARSRASGRRQVPGRGQELQLVEEEQRDRAPGAGLAEDGPGDLQGQMEAARVSAKQAGRAGRRHPLGQERREAGQEHGLVRLAGRPGPELPGPVRQVHRQGPPWAAWPASGPGHQAGGVQERRRGHGAVRTEQRAVLGPGPDEHGEDQASIREQSAGLYPAFAEQIKAGADIQDLAQPYVQVVADELGLPETDVDGVLPKVKAALNRVNAQGAARSPWT
jgi:hypothetical protein